MQSAIGANAFVYTYHYFPGTEFEVVAEIDDAEELLSGRDEEVDPVTRPDDFEGFAIEYDLQAVPLYGIVYVLQDTDLDEGEDGLTLEGTANYVSAEENLLKTRIDEFEAT